MSRFADYFNPDLEEVLADIARDPGARMLRVPSSGALVHATREPGVGLLAPGLTSAEREVLRVYRDELMHLLLDRTRLEFFASPQGSVQWHRFIASDRILEFRNAVTWESDAKTALASPVATDSLRPACSVLEQCISDAGSASISQLAVAAKRLGPRDEPTVHLALDALNRDQLVEAERRLEDVLRDRISPLLASLSWEHHGWVVWKQGRLGDAVPSYENSCRYPGRETPLMSLVTLGVIMLDLRGLERAASRLDDHVQADHAALDDYVRRLRALIRGGEVSVPPKSKLVARSKAECYGPSTARILDELSVR